jgi:hypothetical protein
MLGCIKYMDYSMDLIDRSIVLNFLGAEVERSLRLSRPFNNMQFRAVFCAVRRDNRLKQKAMLARDRPLRVELLTGNENAHGAVVD